MSEDVDEAAEGVRRVYGEIAGAYEAFFPTLHRYEGRVEAFLARAVPPGRRVLDVGCGPGHLTRGLGPDVHVAGVDLVPEMIALAREGRPSGDWRVHSYMRPLPEALGRFDVALAVGCLDFCEELSRVLGHVSGALEPGGRLLFTVLERRPGLAGHEEARRRVATAGPEVTLCFWSFEETARAVREAGLVPERYTHAPGWEHFSERRTLCFGWWEVTRG